MSRKKKVSFQIPQKKEETHQMPAGVDGFIEGAGGGVAQAEGKVQRAAQRKRRARSSSEEDSRLKSSPLRRAQGGQRVVVYLPHDLEHLLRVRSAEERRSMSDVVTAAVQKYLS